MVVSVGPQVPLVTKQLLSVTNTLGEESVSGDFAGLFPDYQWERNVSEAGTNGLFQVDIRVVHTVRKRASSETSMSILLFRPGTGAFRHHTQRRLQ